MIHLSEQLLPEAYFAQKQNPPFPCGQRMLGLSPLIQTALYRMKKTQIPRGQDINAGIHSLACKLKPRQPGGLNPKYNQKWVQCRPFSSFHITFLSYTIKSTSGVFWWTGRGHHAACGGEAGQSWTLALKDPAKTHAQSSRPAALHGGSFSNLAAWWP